MINADSDGAKEQEQLEMPCAACVFLDSHKEYLPSSQHDSSSVSLPQSKPSFGAEKTQSTG